ncbi:MAG: hypothetical protein HXO45_02165 [Prevotella sp.]|uniref:hypothetical protein n=1 Tax=Prevotella sp. TaxID=59823 RepID=UPI001CB58040|nr:hypothetical protein [Prevotella sp.]MBF1633235.1 hypothetical protein [Prevotella sp.]MBF1640026.1 hypothetical protein [Prevotella sp.]
MADNNDSNGCCLGMATIVVLFFLTCVAPGFLLTTVISSIIELTTPQIWGVSLILSLCVFFILKFTTDACFINYTKACLLSIIILISLGLIMGEDSFVGKTIIKATSTNTSHNNTDSITNGLIQNETNTIIKEKNSRQTTSKGGSLQEGNSRYQEKISTRTIIQDEKSEEETNPPTIEEDDDRQENVESNKINKQSNIETNEVEESQ